MVQEALKPISGKDCKDILIYQIKRQCGASWSYYTPKDSDGIKFRSLNGEQKKKIIAGLRDCSAFIKNKNVQESVVTALQLLHSIFQYINCESKLNTHHECNHSLKTPEELQAQIHQLSKKIYFKAVVEYN